MLSWTKFLSIFRRRRILWILNHKTLLPAEVPILESLGFEVFTPATTPSGTEFSSATGRHEKPSTIPAKSHSKLKGHSFYTDPWPSDLIQIINDKFDLVVTAVIDIPLTQALKHFNGPIIARVFGREAPLTYAELFQHYGCTDLIKHASTRFMLGQAYSNIDCIEEDFLKEGASTIGCGVPRFIWDKQNTWTRRRDDLLFICPRIESSPYYREKYDIIKSTFGSAVHTIIGAQATRSDDPSVVGFISDDELFSLYASSAAFVYISAEERHLHYSPIEAIIIGMPVLYMRGSMLAMLAGTELPGECHSLDSMREKADRLVRGDESLQGAIIAGQSRILPPFTEDVVKGQWKAALARFNLI